MAKKILIRIQEVELEAELNESPLATRIAEQLPATVRMSRWGDEYYGSIGLGAENDPEAKDVVEVGTLAYWPPGDALCIFFGPTPVSHGSEPRAASAVSVIGSVPESKVEELSSLPDTVKATISEG